jgi:hypothetical protein
MMESRTTYYFRFFIEHDTVPQRGPLSLHTELEDPSITKLDLFPTGQDVDDC